MSEPRKCLLLLRHASAAPGAPDLDDADRPLDARGLQEAQAAAERLRATRIVPGVVLCSSALRARQTLEGLQAALPPETPLRVDPGLYLASPGEILTRVQDLEDAWEAALVVGHNPGMASLARSLAGTGPPALLERLRSHPPAALSALAFPTDRWRELAPGRGRIEAFSTPAEPS